MLNEPNRCINNLKLDAHMPTIGHVSLGVNNLCYFLFCISGLGKTFMTKESSCVSLELNLQSYQQIFAGFSVYWEEQVLRNAHLSYRSVC